MKHHGCTSEYNRERGLDIVRAYHEHIASVAIIRTNDIFHTIVKMPSKRFWVSEERAAFVIRAIMKGDKLLYMRSNRRAMFFDIYARYIKLHRLFPHRRLIELVSIIIHQCAPRFYLTPNSAKVYFYRYKEEWKKIQQQKLLHSR